MISEEGHDEMEPVAIVNFHIDVKEIGVDDHGRL
jgi:hypothetical protein